MHQRSLPRRKKGMKFICPVGFILRELFLFFYHCSCFFSYCLRFSARNFFQRSCTKRCLLGSASSPRKPIGCAEYLAMQFFLRTPLSANSISSLLRCLS